MGNGNFTTGGQTLTSGTTAATGTITASASGYVIGNLKKFIGNNANVETFEVGTEPWQANAVKLCGNFMIASMLESFSEAFATLRKAQVDPHAFLEIMTALFGSPVYSNYGRLIADGKFEPAGFALRLGLKDVRLVLQTAEECSAPMPIASVSRTPPASGVR